MLSNVKFFRRKGNVLKNQARPLRQRIVFLLIVNGEKTKMLKNPQTNWKRNFLILIQMLLPEEAKFQVICLKYNCLQPYLKISDILRKTRLKILPQSKLSTVLKLSAKSLLMRSLKFLNLLSAENLVLGKNAPITY